MSRSSLFSSRLHLASPQMSYSLKWYFQEQHPRDHPFWQFHARKMFLEVIAVDSSEILNLRQEHQFLPAESKGKAQLWCVWKGSFSPEAKTLTQGTLYLQEFRRESSKCSQCPPIPAGHWWGGNSLQDIWWHLTQDIFSVLFFPVRTFAVINIVKQMS